MHCNDNSTCRNDGKDVNLIRLIHLKTIFSKQLPKMPPQYILRLVFDRKHESLVILRGNEVLGGICYRPFHGQRFAEIAFCAIKATEQIKGWGTKLMNQVLVAYDDCLCADFAIIELKKCSPSGQRAHETDEHRILFDLCR